MTPEQIKEARLRLGLTQKQLAEKLGYADFQRVSELENGRRKPGKAVLLLLERMMEDAK